MNRIAKTLSLLSIGGSLLFVGCISVHHDHHAHADTGKPYPLTTCVVSGEEFHGDPVVFVHEGQEIKLCCEDCLDAFKKDPAKQLAKIAAAKK